jgi:hypothetical protein
MVVGNICKDVGASVYKTGISEHAVTLKSSLIGGFITHLELAVKTIEQVKLLIWSETYGLRASTEELPNVDPGLAD